LTASKCQPYVPLAHRSPRQMRWSRCAEHLAR
jgi:ribosomal protein L24E